MENIIKKNQGLVHKLARRYSCASSDYDDLLQAGNIGLIEAERRFDPTKGASFCTFAYFWVRKLIKEEVAKSHTVIVPANVQAKRNKGENAEACVTCSMESCVSFLANQAQDNFRVNLDSSYSRSLLKNLPEKEREVISYRLAGYSLEEIGLKIGVSGERVRQMEKLAITNVRKLI